jgi:ABC-type transport system involved in cytochrome c biogenesis permease component
MFDYKVMTIYSLAVAPALIVLIVLSFSGLLWAAAVLATLMGLAAYFLLGRIDGKWGRVEFRAA